MVSCPRDPALVQPADPLPFALAEYNAGRSNAQRWALLCGTDDRAFIERITYPTTGNTCRTF
jgi:soluble lytic murein transglycosylase-like protein